MLLGMLRGYHRAQCLMKICKPESAAVSSLVLYCLKINPHLSVLLRIENNNPINISVFPSVYFSISKSMEVSSQSGHVLNGQLSPAYEGMMKWMCSSVFCLDTFAVLCACMCMCVCVWLMPDARLVEDSQWNPSRITTNCICGWWKRRRASAQMGDGNKIWRAPQCHLAVWSGITGCYGLGINFNEGATIVGWILYCFL